MTKKFKVYFPEDFLHGKAKREYRKPSKVTRYNIYEKDINNIPKLDTINITQKFLMSIKKYYTNEELANYFGITIDEFTTTLKSFGME